MEAISNHFATVTGNRTFRSLFTVGTVGFGSWLLWKDWNAPKKETGEEQSKPCSISNICNMFPKFLLYSLLDNSAGLAYQHFIGHDDVAWDNHFKGAVIQIFLSCPAIKGKLKSMKCCPWALLLLSWYFQMKGWSWCCKALFSKEKK